jgi:hypothetical protein
VAGTDDDAVAGVSVLRAAARAAEAAGAALIRREVVALARRTRVPLHPSTPAPSSPAPARSAYTSSASSANSTSMTGSPPQPRPTVSAWWIDCLAPGARGSAL